jgi:D-glycero-alpha-D-manno-heptose-7-phosphate kinase
MRNHLLAHNVDGMSNVLLSAWEDKKAMSDKISNESIEELMQFALNNGAKSGKISGAGGGGFAMYLTEPENRHMLIKALNKLDQGFVMPFTFTSKGAHTWKIN